MKKRGLIRVSHLLIFIMLSTLVACSGNNAVNSPHAQNTGSDPAVTNTTGDSNAAPPTDCTLKLWGMIGNGSVKEPGIQDDAVAKEIERVVGCKIELYPHESDEIFATKLAGGEMPDVFAVNRKFAKQLIDAKAVKPLDELIEEHAPNIAKLDKVLQYDRDFMSDDSKQIYFTTRAAEDFVYNFDVGMMIRWDYYEEMGKPPVNNVDDYINVLAEMMKKHPTTEDGKKVYGLSPYFDWGMWSWTTPAYIYGMWNHGILDYDMANNLQPSNVVTNEQSSFWKTVEIYYKAKQKGILDPDSFTQKFDNAMQKNRDLRVLGGFASFWFGDPNTKFQTAGEAKGFMPIPPAEGTKAFWAGYWQPLGADSHYAISSHTKYPEQAIKLLDYLYSPEGNRTLRSGVKGEHWDEVNGEYEIKPEVLEQRQKDPDFSLKTGIGRYGFLTGLPNEFRGEQFDLFSLPKYQKQSPLQKEYYAEYGVKDGKELLDQRVENKVVNTAVLLLQPLQPDDTKRIDDKIIDYITKAAVKVVLAKSDKEYEQLKKQTIEEVKKMDFDQSDAYWTKVSQDIKDYMDKNDLSGVPAK
ncbi:extracellular solute-binding protein [Paenibacillus glycanilyticus]|uniref:ABC transporter substrate-binding protein n=1 Tax=Paenibacillus glycanilyticus TaxID=126569 RepID=A0ABQ6GHA3_9BACL|nr:extracellular solute-binding protein [Paenibacillus glycanilyticus]GLX68437.1 ABC transporter substrate-binding protein [Paenibacillus glycanilyticus]